MGSQCVGDTLQIARPPRTKNLRRLRQGHLQEDSRYVPGCRTPERPDFDHCQMANDHQWAVLRGRREQNPPFSGTVEDRPVYPDQ